MAQAATRVLRREAARPRPVTDTIGRTLIVVFLIKPIVDLFPQAAIWMGPIRLAPTTVFGVVMFFWMVRFLFGRGRLVPPYGRLWEAFLVVNAISLALGLAMGTTDSLPLTVATVFKILDSYVIFSAAYLAAQRHGYNDIRPFMTAIVVGEAIVVFANVLAINLGLTGLFAENASFDMFSGGRERGLYFDPGVLANVAFFSLVFTVFRFHLAKSGRALWLVFTVVVVLADIYLIALAQSRAAMIQIAIFGVIYILLYQRSWGKIVAPVVVALMILVATTFMGESYDEMFSRFESDIAALEAEGEQSSGVGASGKISFGKYEALGSNRGMLWAEALNEIAERSLPEIVLGNFSFKTGAHSDYIDVLARNGIVGLVIFIVLIFGMARRTYGYAKNAPPGHDRALHFLAFTLILCFILYAVPFRPLGYTTTSWYMWTMLAFSLAWGSRRGRPGVAAAMAAQPAVAADAGAAGDPEEEEDVYARRD